MVNTMEATEKQIAQGKKVLETICAMLDSEELKYQRDDEDISVQVTFNGNDFDIILVFKIVPDRELVMLFSPLTFNAPEDGRQDIAMAMTVLNNITYDGMWTISLPDGEMQFRVTNSYCDSIIGKACYKDMMSLAITANHQFADKFFMLGKGATTFKQFIDDLFGDDE